MAWVQELELVQQLLQVLVLAPPCSSPILPMHELLAPLFALLLALVDFILQELEVLVMFRYVCYFKLCYF